MNTEKENLKNPKNPGYPHKIPGYPHWDFGEYYITADQYNSIFIGCLTAIPMKVSKRLILGKGDRITLVYKNNKITAGFYKLDDVGKYFYVKPLKYRRN